MRNGNTSNTAFWARPFSIGKIGEADAYETIFMVSYGIWLIAMLLLSTFFAVQFGSRVFSVARYAGLLGAALSIFMRKDYKATEVFIFFLAAVLIYISTRTNAPMLIDLIIFVYCGRLIDFKKVAKESLWISSLVLLIVVLSAETGLIKNYVSVVSEVGVVRRREYLGFLYALQPAQIMFNVTLLFIFLRGERFSVPCAVSLLVANIFIYLKADARLSTLISIGAIFVALLLCRSFGQKSLGRFLLVLAPLAFVVCFVFSWATTVNYSAHNPLLYELNHILGNRLSLGQNALDMYGTTLFGQSIDFVGNGLGLDGRINRTGSYNYVDCLYVRLPLLYGWVFTAFFIIGMTIASVWAAWKHDYRIALILTAIALHCVVDDLVIRLQFCTFLFLIANSFVEMTKGCLARRRLKASSTRSPLEPPIKL